MNQAYDFLICCIEEYKFLHHLSGREAYSRFHDSGADEWLKIPWKNKCICNKQK